MRPEEIFDYVYPNDNGLESPNLTNKFLYHNAGIKSLEPYLKQIGIPYKWCQLICGLNYENRTDKNSVLGFISSDLKSRKVQEDESSELLGKKLTTKDADAQNLNGSSIIANGKEENENANSINSNNRNAKNQINSSNSNSYEPNDTEIFEHILSRLISRFKAKFILNETLYSLSKQ